MKPQPVVAVLLGVALLSTLLSVHPTISTFSIYSYGALEQLRLDESLASYQPKPSLAHLVGTKEKNRAVVFVGDVLLARNVEFLMSQRDGSYPFEGLSFTGDAKSFVVGNFESPIPRKHVPTIANEMNFSVDERFLPFLQNAGFTHVSLANNHSLDRGRGELIRTQAVLHDTGIVPFGDPDQLTRDSVSFLSTKNGELALIGIHALKRAYSEPEIDSLLAYASARSDMQIVYIHWGTEYAAKANVLQREMAAQLVRAGADLIVGHHPHVVQNIELIDGVVVFYSLGNYIFDQYLSKDTEQGLVVVLDQTEETELLLVPVSSEDTLSQPQVLKEKDRKLFLHDLALRSDARLSAGIEHGRIRLDSLVASSTKIAMIGK